jgi:predicted ABC-type transport system involved in lysophospholipase L1 biosynthesis ATPase subunit
VLVTHDPEIAGRARIRVRMQDGFVVEQDGGREPISGRGAS